MKLKIISEVQFKSATTVADRANVAGAYSTSSVNNLIKPQDEQDKSGNESDDDDVLDDHA